MSEEESDFWKSLDGLLMRIDMLAQNLVWKAYNEAMQHTLRFEGVTWVEWVSDYTQDPKRGPCNHCDVQAGRRYHLGQFMPSMPAHPNCLPGDALVSPCGRITGATKRKYQGDLTVIHTAAGRDLSVTPNHPVLTRQGWVAAGLLKKGDKVICQSSRHRKLLLNNHHQNVPARIEKVADAFCMLPSTLVCEVPTAAEDFHGDGRDGEVAVVGTNRLLMLNRQTSFSKHICKPALIGGDSALVSFNRLRQLNLFRPSLLSSAGSHVRSLDLVDSLLRSHLPPLQQFSFMAASDRDVRLDKSRSDRSSAYMKSFGNSLLRNPGDIHGDNFVDVVVEVGASAFQGGIYNLETSVGYFRASDIIVSNCRCEWAPILPE